MNAIAFLETDGLNHGKEKWFCFATRTLIGCSWL